MIIPYRFDPTNGNYGPATQSVRSLFATWKSIQWLNKTQTPDAYGVELFVKHNQLAHRYAPNLFAQKIALHIETGTEHDFAAACQRVRTSPSFDWKFNVLKELSSKHSHDHQWSIDKIACHPDEVKDPSTAYAFKTHMGISIYNSISQDFPFDLYSHRFMEQARFYLSYATGDLYDCINWQLAKNHSDTSDNPFVPLLQCYLHGFYPFVLRQDIVILFRFQSDPLRQPIADVR
jgi:hypothetical protein